VPAPCQAAGHPSSHCERDARMGPQQLSAAPVLCLDARLRARFSRHMSMNSVPVMKDAWGAGPASPEASLGWCSSAMCDVDATLRDIMHTLLVQGAHSGTPAMRVQAQQQCINALLSCTPQTQAVAAGACGRRCRRAAMACPAQGIGPLCLTYPKLLPYTLTRPGFGSCTQTCGRASRCRATRRATTTSTWSPSARTPRASTPAWSTRWCRAWSSRSRRALNLALP